MSGIIWLASYPKSGNTWLRAFLEELRGQERDLRFVESRFDGKSKFFREGRSRQWREVLNQQQIQRLIDAHRAALQDTGYLAPDGAILAA